MSNADLPAMPQDRELWIEDIGLCPTEATGLTKREMFAMHAMQGFLSNSGGVVQANNMSGTGFCNSDETSLAQWSIAFADALLAELEK